MTRALLLRLFVVLALLLGNLALWGSNQASAAAPGTFACGFTNGGVHCSSATCASNSWECCDTDCQCGDC